METDSFIHEHWKVFIGNVPFLVEVVTGTLFAFPCFTLSLIVLDDVFHCSCALTLIRSGDRRYADELRLTAIFWE